MTPALPNPFTFRQQEDLDILGLQAIAGELGLDLEEPTPEPEPVIDLPVFLRDPSPAYLSATELRPICEIITSHARRASH